MVKSYIARKGTRKNVKSMAAVTGGYAATARLVNRNSSGKRISANQIQRVAEGKGTTGSGAEDNL